MRKMLTATIVAMVLFAVGAFAASFALNAEDVASGVDEVEACAKRVDVDFETALDAGVYKVTGAKLVYYSALTGSPPPTTTACDAFQATVSLLGSTNNNLGTATGVANTTLSFTTAVPVSDVLGAAVLVDGKEIDVNTP